MPAPDVRSFRRPDWEPLPYDGCVNVEGRVIHWDETIGLAVLRFGEHAKIHEHAGPNDTIVSCLEGRGYTSVGGVTSPLQSGEIVMWPAGIEHGLWTEDSTMTTLMCERPAAGTDNLAG
jgi:quercetin dioxygenase-like cupin family protein